MQGCKNQADRYLPECFLMGRNDENCLRIGHEMFTTARSVRVTYDTTYDIRLTVSQVLGCLTRIEGEGLYREGNRSASEMRPFCQSGKRALRSKFSSGC